MAAPALKNRPGRRLLGFLLGFFIIFIGAVAGIGGYAAHKISKESAGYIHVGWDGVYTQHAVMRKDAKTVHLIGMMHIAEPGFYERVLDRIPIEKSLVLEEGVTDRQKLLTDGLDYDGLAKTLGWDSQGQVFVSPLRESRHVMSGDIDISAMSPQAIANLRVLGKIMKGDMSEENMQALKDNDFAGRFAEEFLAQRTRHLMKVFDEQLPHYDVLTIPWGALHLSEVETLLRERGFKRASEEDVRLFGFFKLFRPS